MTSDYNNPPIPPVHHTGMTGKLKSLHIGESFVWNGQHASIRNLASKIGIKVSIRKFDDSGNWRVWRTG